MNKKSTDREGWSFDAGKAPRGRRSFLLRWPVVGLLCVGLPVAAGLAVMEADHAWNASGEALRTIADLWLYWSLWLIWPIAVLLLVRLVLRLRTGRRGAAAATAMGLITVAIVIWAHFIEPAQLRVVETTLGNRCGVRVALISDLHIGTYTRPIDLDRLVTQINALNVDAVLVAGDWTHAPPQGLQDVFAPWSRLRARNIGVLGAREEQPQGPHLKDPLRQALQGYGTDWIDGRRVAMGQCELVGLGDLGSGSAQRDIDRLKTQRSSVPPERRIVLTHNPDAAALLPKSWATLVLAGRTHGGQVDLSAVKLPTFAGWLPHSRTGGLFHRGLYERADVRIFVTSGIGLDDWPFRLGMPPTIDVLTL